MSFICLDSFENSRITREKVLEKCSCKSPPSEMIVPDFSPSNLLDFSLRKNQVKLGKNTSREKSSEKYLSFPPPCPETASYAILMNVFMCQHACLPLPGLPHPARLALPHPASSTGSSPLQRALALSCKESWPLHHLLLNFPLGTKFFPGGNGFSQ